ncbi:MAG: BPSL0067 family protein, partial [Tagaea sp.]|nr:BPSL0067 family protein [Tagaea sp.]
PWEPKDPAAQAPAQSDIRDMAWRPGRDGEAQPMPLPHKIRTPEEEARDIVPISYDTRAGTQAPVHDDFGAEGAADDEDEVELEINEDEDGDDETANSDLRASTRDGSYRVASGPATTMTDATPQPAAPSRPARPSVTRRENAWVYDDPNDIKERARQNGGRLGRNRQCVALLQGTNPELGHTTTWRAGDQVRGPGDPPLKPGTAIATFAPDKNANGELRYPSPEGQTRAEGERIRRHAGIFTRYGTHNGREGIWMVDQYAQPGGQVQERFHPFERRPGERGYGGREFSVIRSSK